MEAIAGSGSSLSVKLPRIDWLPITTMSCSPMMRDADRRMCASSSRVTSGLGFEFAQMPRESRLAPSQREPPRTGSFALARAREVFET